MKIRKKKCKKCGKTLEIIFIPGEVGREAQSPGRGNLQTPANLEYILEENSKYIHIYIYKYICTDSNPYCSTDQSKQNR